MNLNNKAGEYSGVICIDKPKEHTSFDVIARMRGITKIKKIGHAGTLDPMATGVLPIFIGRATKACDILPVQDKRYTATLRLGMTTDTQDITGTVLKERPVTSTEEEITAAIFRFRGAIKQLPPMYSAIQVGGQRLYDLARQGIEVERAYRDAVIYSLDILDSDPINHRYVLDIHCSKGTYVRTICHDIGEQLGCGGVLTELRRTMSSGFTIEDCLTLEEAQALAAEDKLLEGMLPIEKAFDSLSKIRLEEKLTRLYLNGIKLDAKRTKAPITGEDIAVYSANGTFLGVSYYDETAKLLEYRNIFCMGLTDSL